MTPGGIWLVTAEPFEHARTGEVIIILSSKMTVMSVKPNIELARTVLTPARP